MSIPQQPVYYVVTVVTIYESFEDAMAKAPEIVAAHLEHSQELHTRGTLFMSGVFLHTPQEPLTAMAIHTTREAAEAYVNAFVESGLVRTWSIREWANMFA
jgi:uncharacterized protein YciI